jgi:hypothetical protein
VIRSSAFLLLLAAGAAFAQQPWHGPYEPQREIAKPAAQQPKQQPQRFLRDTPHVWLAQMVHYKLSNAEYAAALNARGKIPSSFHMAEEQWIRQARSEISRLRKAPPGVRVLTIPRVQIAPTLDGKIHVEEWKGALQVPLEPAAAGSVLLLAHGGQLYVAARAVTDKTDEGFDQFRFWFHIDLSPYLRNERVFLAGKGWLGQLRDVYLPPEREPILESPEPGKLTHKTDWNIFERSRGASKVDGFRQYELQMDMAELGLFAGAPFPAFFEVEGDPVYEAGKFKARTILGTAGSKAAPIWFHIAP